MEREKPSPRQYLVDVVMIALFILAMILLYPSWRRFQKDAMAME